MSLFALTAAVALQGADSIMLVERPVPLWTSNRTSAGCRILSADVEWRQERNRGVVALKGEIRHLDATRSIEPELSAAKAGAAYVSNVGIVCQSDRRISVIVEFDAKTVEISMDESLQPQIIESKK